MEKKLKEEKENLIKKINNDNYQFYEIPNVLKELFENYIAIKFPFVERHYELKGETLQNHFKNLFDKNKKYEFDNLKELLSFIREY